MTDDTTSTTRIAIDETRRVIRVAGTEAEDFLQSLVTANVGTLPVAACRPGALLTPQGRILADMMIHRRHDGFLLECDATRADDLFTRLRRYRLRRPIDLAQQHDACVWVGWGHGDAPSGACIDPRHPDLGWRWIGPAGEMPPTTGMDDIVPLDNWHARRIAAGVPQGPVDLVPERALMLEAGLDRLIRAGYGLLDLLTFFTAGPKETRAWTVHRHAKAPEAAGVIHTDFQRGFIRAETVAYADFIEYGGEAGAKEAGKLRVEGSDYLVKDGDIFHFRFNV